MLFALWAVQLLIWYGIYRFMLLVPETMQPGKSAVPVSVLIAARNEAENLRLYLPEILDQDYPEFEVIVINDCSTDDTAAVLNAYAEQYAHLRVLHLSEKKHPGKKQALREALKAARYDRLVFTDADCRPATAQWLRYMSAGLDSRTQVVLGVAPFFKSNGFLNRWARFENSMTALRYNSFAHLGMPYMGVGRNMAIEKNALNQLSPYQRQSDLAGGDDDLTVNQMAHAKNTVVEMHPDTFVFSSAPLSWRAWLRQKMRHAGVGIRYRTAHLLVLTLVSFSRALFHLVCAIYLFTPMWAWALGALVSRWLLIMPLFARACRRLQCPDLLLYFPLFDLMLSVYDAFVIPLSVFRDKTKW